MMDTGLATLPSVGWLNTRDSASRDGYRENGSSGSELSCNFGKENFLESKDVSLEAGHPQWLRW